MAVREDARSYALTVRVWPWSGSPVRFSGGSLRSIASESGASRRGARGAAEPYSVDGFQASA